MKRLLILLMCVLIVFGGCSAKETAVISDGEEVIEINESEEIVENDFYKMATSPKRPIAVMIDNDSEASRPQIGLEDAYLVYEIIVEGGASRIMALFKNYRLEKVGPVRSARHYFLDYALENGAIYTHAGWSPQAQRDIGVYDVDNINGLIGNDTNNFWRDSTYDNTWHNLYTSTAKLSEYARSKKDYKMKASEGPVSFLKEDKVTGDTDCTKLSFAYSQMYRVGFTYNPETAMYERIINGKPHLSQTGKAFPAKNIIIYDVPNYTLNDGQNKGRQDLQNTGEGEGWYVSMGKAEKITCSKKSRTSKTLYKRADGTELEVNPGVTYIQIVPKGNAVNME